SNTIIYQHHIQHLISSVLYPTPSSPQYYIQHTHLSTSRPHIININLHTRSATPIHTDYRQAYNMHTTVVRRLVASSPKDRISSLLALGDRLLLATATGALLVYPGPDSNAPDSTADSAPDSLIRRIDTFARRPIEQLAAIKEAAILLTLSDNLVSVHDLHDFSLLHILPRTKGASLFATTTNVQRDPDGIPMLVSRLAVIVKRKVLLYAWNDTEFSEGPEFSLPERPKTLAFMASTKLIFGLSTDYSILDLDSMQLSQVFSSTFAPIPWKTAPENIGYSHPYLVAMYPKHIEIRNLGTNSLVQQIELPNATILHSGKSLYVASQTLVWKFLPNSYESQVDELIASKQLDEAISLMTQLEDILFEDKESKLRHLRSLKAKELFENRRYDDSMTLFSEISAHPSSVLELCPANIACDNDEDEIDHSDPSTPESASLTEKPFHEGDTPRSSRLLKISSLATLSDANLIKKHSETVSPNKPVDWKKASRSLLIYLTDSRRKVSKYISILKNDETEETVPIHQFTTLPEKFLSIYELEVVARLIDTALFRVYMIISPGLVGPLVRVQNSCDPEVVHSLLEMACRYRELVDFCFGKGLHRKALELLKKLGQDTKENDLSGPAPTVRYLQRLGNLHLDLIFEFALWPLTIDPDLAMEAYTAESDSLPSDQVCAYLLHYNRRLAIRYLEHIIHELGSINTECHYQLAGLYREEIQSMEEAGEFIGKLETFLSESQYYKPDRLLRSLPKNDPVFWETQTILLGKMGHHDRALSIYVFQMQDHLKAESYCQRIYNSPNPDHSVFLTLLKLYLKPPSRSPVQVSPALAILSRHGSRLNARETLNLLPPTTHIAKLVSLLTNHIRIETSQLHESRVLSNLEKFQLLRTQEKLITYRNKRYLITHEKTCPCCHKRLGQSVIAAFPDGSVVHYSCQKNHIKARDLQYLPG
ncbi:Vam6/Vps39-like protein, partial [Neolecta irregularis DAH-3]